MARYQTIGLLGGSFNPAHEGHLHLSEEAIKRLKLDAVWWLVSPQNPLKQKKDLASYEKRLTHARQLTIHHRRIQICDFEARHHLYYSIDTIAALQCTYPNTRFIWLIGADNLQIFHKWRHWPELFTHLPIAVFDRAPFSHSALRSKAAIRFHLQRLKGRHATRLKQCRLPCWTYCFMPRHAQSATAVRQRGKWTLR